MNTKEDFMLILPSRDMLSVNSFHLQDGVSFQEKYTGCKQRFFTLFCTTHGIMSYQERIKRAIFILKNKHCHRQVIGVTQAFDVYQGDLQVDAVVSVSEHCEVPAGVSESTAVGVTRHRLPFEISSMIGTVTGCC